MEQKKYEFYDKNGELVNDENSAYAKKVHYDLHESDDGKLTQYFIKSCNSQLCNPINFENKRRTLRNHVKFTKTSELAFLLYIRFLKTKNQSAYSQAQRQVGM